MFELPSIPNIIAYAALLTLLYFLRHKYPVSDERDLDDTLVRDQLIIELLQNRNLHAENEMLKDDDEENTREQLIDVLVANRHLSEEVEQLKVELYQTHVTLRKCEEKNATQ